MKEHLVLLGSNDADLAYLYEKLKDVANIVLVVIENPVPRLNVVKRRLRTFGALNTLGQLLFIALVQPILTLTNGSRIESLAGKAALPQALVHRVASVNSPEAITAIQRAEPTVGLVYGTRLIQGKTLRALPCELINIHAGITPRYRGGHGAYWAYYDGRPEFAGVTVHRVDEGIDTGDILAQGVIEKAAQDSFVTYPYLQREAGVLLVRKLLEEGRKRWVPVASLAPEHGALRSHPTLWGYFATLLTKGVV